MAQALAGPTEADDIQRQMREVRVELRDDVRDLVTSAQDMGDWTSYVKAYPWLCVGAAAIVGYFLVPTRRLVVHPDRETLFKLAKEHKLVMEPAESQGQKKKGGLASQLVSMAAAAALQGGLRIATQQLAQAISSAGQQHSNGHAGAHHD
jgi:hypothetical protein